MKKNQQDNKRARSVAEDTRTGRQNRIRMIVIPLIALVVIAAIGIGVWRYHETQVKPFNQPAIIVNDVTFDLGYYINTMNIYYGNIAPSVLTDYSNFGDQQIEQLAAYVEELIVKNEIIRQGSALLGVEIDRDTVRDKLKELGVDASDERVDITLAEELMETQVPSSQPQVHAQVMLLESQEAAQQILDRLQAGESFGQLSASFSRLPDATENGDLGWVASREVDLMVGSTQFGDTLIAAEAGVIGGPVYDDTVTKQFGYWVMKVIEKEDATGNTSARVHIQGILLASEAEAVTIIDKLNAGGDINELAKQYSQSTGAEENGATEGWVTQRENLGNMNALFDLSLDEISSPISDNSTTTPGGYWVYNILEKDENRELTSEQKSALDDDLMNTFVLELNSDPDFNLESVMTDEMKVFAINETVLEQGKGSVLMRSSEIPHGEAGVAYSSQLEAYGNQKGNTWIITKGGLPKGLSLDSSTGIISGTPELAGASSLTLRVSSSTHHWEQDFVFYVHIAVKITTDSIPEGQVGESYVTTLEVFGDSNWYTWTLVDGEIPEGLQLYSTSGRISGTPVTAGTYDFTVQVDDGYGTDTRSFSLTITGADLSESE